MSEQETVIKSRSGGKAVRIEPKLMVVGQNYDYELDDVPFRVILQPNRNLAFFVFPPPSLWSRLQSWRRRSGSPS